jgi:hypothetical protein
MQPKCFVVFKKLLGVGEIIVLHIGFVCFLFPLSSFVHSYSLYYIIRVSLSTLAASTSILTASTSTIAYSIDILRDTTKI